MEGEFAEADKIEEINEMSYAKNKTSVVVNCTMLYPVSEIRGIIISVARMTGMKQRITESRQL